MKSHTPNATPSTFRIFTALFISLIILVTPVMPVAAASLRFAGRIRTDLLNPNIPMPDAARPGVPLNPQAPASTIVSATKTDSFSDPDNDGKAEPGDTITYDVNISNTGANDATGVNFTDTIDSNTTLVPGSLRVSPLAFADTYNATKDVPLNIAAPGVLVNDTGTPAPSAVAIAGGSTSGGGTVTLNSDGSFNYTPASGFTGTDTFTYTATNGLTPDDTATVTINVDAGPTVTTTSPTNGTTNVATNTNITVNFSEPVNATTSSFSVECPAGSPQSYTLSASPASSFTLNPTADLPAGASCTVTVFANQITDADTFDPPDQMAANYVFSFGTKPDAVDDMHSATGNVRIDTTGSGFSVLANDNTASPVTITAFDATSAQGGSVTMNTSTGTFTYDPPRGFTGTDSFTYTISNANGSDTGTVVLTVTDMIWFINNSAGACAPSGCGRLTSPYNSLSAFEAVNGAGGTGDPEAGDNIFIYTGGGSYTGPLTLENNQRVIGQGAASSIETLAGFTLAPDSNALPATGGTNPVITNPSDGGIILAQSNAIHGLTISNTTGTGLSGNNFGTLTVSENVVVSNTTTAGVPVILNNGTLAATFRSISAGNNTADPDPVNGIVLTNTTGAFIVDGDGSNTSVGGNSSGGTIQNTAGADGATDGNGVFLNNASGVTLRRMTITGTNTNHAIRGINVTGFSLEYSTVSGSNGTSAALDEGSVNFDNLLGTAAINNSLISGGFEDNLNVVNTSGSLNRLVITGSTFGFNSTVGGNNNILLEARNPGTVIKYTLQSSLIKGARADWLNAQPASGGTMDAIIGGSTAALGNTFDNTGANAHPGPVANGNRIVLQANGTSTFSIANNTLKGSLGSAIATNSLSFTSLMDGVIKSNNIGNAATANSGSTGGSAISIQSSAGGNVTVLIDGNTLRQYNNTAILFTLGDQQSHPPTINATVTNNSVNTPGTLLTNFNGLQLNNGTVSTDSFTACVDIHDNSMANSGSGTINPNNVDIRLRQRQATTVRLPGYAGANNDNTAVQNYLQGRNTLRAQPNGAAAANTVPTGGGYTGGATCTQPSVARLSPIETNQRDMFASTVEPSQNASNTSADKAPNSFFANLSEAMREALALEDAQGEGAELTNGKFTAAANQASLAHNRKAGTSKIARSANAAPVMIAQPAPSGETVSANIGTLPAGKSVRVQFQVTVNSPLPNSVTQVSNQGTVSGTNFTSVQTDDPAAGGSADPTVTPILTPPDLSIKDASVAEPASGSAVAAFAVVLSHAYTHTVTVNFATANDTGGANPATAGSDYTSTTGTLTFNPGETIQTISVPVLADADASETDETFLVNLSGATNVNAVTDAQAVGTIKANSTPGTVLISELRTSGPGGPDDDFVELQNNTDSDITVSASDASAGWAIVKSGSGCSDTPVIIAVIPNGTVIPARGNYLLVGSAYSLITYAAGDQTLNANIEDDRNVALFNTADLSNLQTATRLDAVGFGANTGNNCDLLREGSTLQPASGSVSEYSFVRKVDKGETMDTNDNSADFVVVSTTPATPVGSNTTPTLGAPGPENAASPRGPVPCSSTGTAKFDRARLDTSQAVGASPNKVRDTTPDALNNSTYGTLDFRRRFTNNTGGNVTRLRFRIVDMTTKPAPSGTADLRARTSLPITVAGVNDVATCNGSAPCSVLVEGTLLETPPVQASGGGVNSSLAVGTITLGTPLANGASANLHFLFGVEQEGDYHIGIVIETLTAGSLGQDIWELRGNTQSGNDTDGDCNAPPVANAGPDQTVECAGGSTPVVLDGSASTDPDGDTPLTYEWREGVTILGTGQTLNTSLAFGSHTITLKVTDPSGAFGEDTLIVDVVDTTNPSIQAPPNVTAYTGPGATSCGTYVSDATLGTATASDGCSASVTVMRTGVPSGNNFPVGQTIITYTADDGHGHTSQAMQTVTVIDNTPPTINVPADITVNAPANSCSANIDPGTATANDNCPNVTVTGVRSDNLALNAPYPVGVTTITWTAKDAANNTVSGVQTITVKDAQAPVITLTTGTLTLSPPNHSYQTFTIADLVASASDLCDASVDINDVVISQVTSDEPEDAAGIGDGNTLNDIVITPDCKSVQLRKERAGSGNGRVYTITLKVRDSSGNVGVAVRQVFVPNGGPAIDSGAQYSVSGCTP